MGLQRLTFQQLFEYLEGGEQDPYVQASLDMAGNRERLRQARRLYDLIKGGGLQGEGPRAAEFAGSVSEIAFDTADQPLDEDILEAGRTHPFGKDETRELNQSEDGLHQAVQTMRRGGERLRASGTLRIETSDATPDLEYVPRPRQSSLRKSSRASARFEGKASFESAPSASLELDVSGIMFRKSTRRDGGEQRKILPEVPPSVGRVGFSLAGLRVECRVDLTHHNPQLAFDIQDTRWLVPAKQLEILYVPDQGPICRATTALDGSASLPLPTESGRLRFDSDPSVAVDIEIQN